MYIKRLRIVHKMPRKIPKYDKQIYIPIANISTILYAPHITHTVLI